jgi:signal peptidase I
MDKNKECSVIKDLMPLYKDQALSELSVQAVEEHIEKCDSCREYKNCIFKDSIKFELADDTPEFEKVETQNYKNIAIRLKKRKVRNTVIAIFSTILVIILFSSMFAFQKVCSDAMKPTFEVGDICFINKMSYKLFKPSEGDIVCLLREDITTKSVTRIIGIPGDKILIKDGVLYVNGEEKYKEIYNNIKKAGTASTEFTVPDGKYFFMGDNSDISYDSRFEEVGCADEGDILGKVYFKW